VTRTPSGVTTPSAVARRGRLRSSGARAEGRRRRHARAASRSGRARGGQGNRVERRRRPGRRTTATGPTASRAARGRGGPAAAARCGIRHRRPRFPRGSGPIERQGRQGRDRRPFLRRHCLGGGSASAGSAGPPCRQVDAVGGGLILGGLGQGRLGRRLGRVSGRISGPVRQGGRRRVHGCEFSDGWRRGDRKWRVRRVQRIVHGDVGAAAQSRATGLSGRNSADQTAIAARRISKTMVRMRPVRKERRRVTSGLRPRRPPVRLASSAGPGGMSSPAGWVRVGIRVRAPAAPPQAPSACRGRRRCARRRAGIPCRTQVRRLRIGTLPRPRKPPSRPPMACGRGLVVIAASPAPGNGAAVRPDRRPLRCGCASFPPATGWHDGLGRALRPRLAGVADARKAFGQRVLPYGRDRLVPRVGGPHVRRLARLRPSSRRRARARERPGPRTQAARIEGSLGCARATASGPSSARPVAAVGDGRRVR
jgi:hypothetical protein